jgi:hypothetical protein
VVSDPFFFFFFGNCWKYLNQEKFAGLHQGRLAACYLDLLWKVEVSASRHKTEGRRSFMEILDSGRLEVTIIKLVARG